MTVTNPLQPGLGASRLSALADAFNAAFEGYFVPMRHTEDSLATMVRTNDIRLADSLIAAPRPATCWASASSASAARAAGSAAWRSCRQHRGHGYGARLLDRADRPCARPRPHRAAARSPRPERRRPPPLHAPGIRRDTPAGRLHRARAICTPRQPARQPSQRLPVAEALAHFAELHAVASPWQREDASLLHMAPTLSGLALRDAHGLRSYLLWMPSGGGYALLDFGSRSRRRRRARKPTPLPCSPNSSPTTTMATLRAINIPPGDALGDALTSLELPRRRHPA